MRNIAIVMLNQVVTKMQKGSEAILVPSISSKAWDAGIATRMVLFRDWGWDNRPTRFVGVSKLANTMVSGAGGIGRVMAFTIQDVSGIRRNLYEC